MPSLGLGAPPPPSQIVRAARSEISGPLAFVAYVGLIFALLGGIVAIGVATASREWAVAGAWTTAIVLALALVWMLVPKTKRTLPPTTTYFQPFGDLKETQVWDRTEPLDALAAALAAPTGRACVVVGASGVGKSVLLKHCLAHRLDRAMGEDYVYTNSYEPTAEDLHGLAQVDGRVVVLDQFEQYLAWLRTLTVDKREATGRAFAEHFGDRIANGGITLVIAVRSEWYYDLRGFGDLIPPLDIAIEIGAPSYLPGDPVGRKIVNDLVAALSLEKPETAEGLLAEMSQDGRLPPLQIQLVGATLERVASRRRIGDGFSLPEIGGVSGAISTYFEEVLRGAHDRHVALKVLCALSTRTRARQQDHMDDLYDALYERPDDVAQAIEDMEEQGLVVPVRRSKYRLAHDYLAEVFHQECASELDPTERDNVEFHIETQRRRDGDRSNAHSPQIAHTDSGPPDPLGANDGSIVLDRQRREDKDAKPSLAMFVLVALVVVMTLRLLYFGISDWYIVSSGPRPRPLLGGAVLDETYLPIYVAQLAWAVYLGLFYHRIFRYLNESGRARMLSLLTIFAIPPCAIVSMLIPAAWVMPIAICGMILGVKILTLAWARDVNQAARERIRVMGRITTGNMIVAALIGGVVLGMSIVVIHGEPGTRYWTIAMIAFSTIITLLCFALIPAHVGRRATGLILGVLARPAEPNIPLPEL